MPIDEPGEEHIRSLTFPGNGQEIVVRREQHALERSRAVQQRRGLRDSRANRLSGVLVMGSLLPLPLFCSCPMSPERVK
jgi:hypothetical protein